MAQYIDKTALVAEIEKELNTTKKYSTEYVNGKKYALKKILSFLDILEVKEIGVDFGDPEGDIGVKWVQEEPASKDLEEAARKIATRHSRITGDTYYANDAWFFKKGAQWQKEQMEKNRIAHCDNITEEQYNLETGFLDGFLDKNKRMPTFLDAIEYGMKKAQKGG